MNTAASISTHAARLPMMLTELRLPSIKRLWPNLAAQSDREGWPAEKLLAMLLEHEIAEREQRRLARHRLESNLSADKTLANFDFIQLPSVSKAQISALAAGDAWIEKGANLLLFGPPGSGKTHLISALGHALIDRGFRVPIQYHRITLIFGGYLLKSLLPDSMRRRSARRCRSNGKITRYLRNQGTLQTPQPMAELRGARTTRLYMAE